MTDLGVCDILLRSARTVDRAELVDIAIKDGDIIARGRELTFTAERVIEVGGRLVSPGFVESHLHLDIALMNDGAIPGRHEAFQSMDELGERVKRGRKAFTVDEIKRRALRGVERALRHGVIAIRAQCHVDPEVGLRHLQALLAVKEAASGKVDLQIVAFPEQGLLGKLDLFREAIRHGADIMGCSPDLEPGSEDRLKRVDHIDAAFEVAMELNVDVDTHVDLALLEEPEIGDLDVLYLAEKTIAEGYQGRVTAGHVCGLDSLPYDLASQVIERIAEARLHIISQPDLYRVGRMDPRHVRRGLTRVKELLAAGVNVSLASNNVRDVLRPLGNFDLLEEALVLAYGAHMDRVDQLDDLLRMCTYNPAKALNLERYGLDIGCHADLVVLDAESPSGAIVDQAEKAYVLKRGKIMATTTRHHVSYSNLAY